MADETTVEDLIDYYVNLLIIQYSSLPNATAMITLCISEMLANGIAFDVQEAYNLNTAVGVQLDVLGKYAGIDRFYQGQDLSGYFAFTNYSESVIPADKIGFSTYALFPNKPGKWLNYDDVLSNTQALGDDDFRTLIRLKIIENNSNYSHEQIDEEMFNAFANGIRPDSVGNMQMFYFIQAQYAAIGAVAFQKGVLPKPMGVQLFAIQQTNPFFGFGTYNSISPFITGFTTYASYGTKLGETLDYAKISV